MLAGACAGVLAGGEASCGRAFAVCALSWVVAARVCALILTSIPSPVKSGLLSGEDVGPLALVILVTGLSPDMFWYRSESGARSVDGLISFGFITKGVGGVPNNCVSGKAALGFDASGRF